MKLPHTAEHYLLILLIEYTYNRYAIEYTSQRKSLLLKFLENYHRISLTETDSLGLVGCPEATKNAN